MRLSQFRPVSRGVLLLAPLALPAFCGVAWLLASPQTAVQTPPLPEAMDKTAATVVLVTKAPTAAPVSLIGMIPKTHAVRHPTPGGFRDAFEFTFIRFLEHDKIGGELAVPYRYEWDTALPEDLENGHELLGEQTVNFPAPGEADLARGFQASLVTIKVAQGDERASAARGRHFTVSLIESEQGDYALIDISGRLVRPLNRRYAERFADCFIYEGCVVACLPNDQPSPAETHAVDDQDLDQYVPDCYLIAALVAAVRRDPRHVLDLIRQTPEGYVVTFPEHPPIAVPLDIDRGPDMIEAGALDLNARGEIELWPILLERAFLVLRSRSKPDGAGPGQEFQDVNNGDAQSAYYILTGKEITEYSRPDYPSRQAQLRAIEQHLKSSRPVMMSTGKWTQPAERPEWWLEDHVYVIASIGSSSFAAIDPSCGQLVERIKIGDWFDSTEVKRFLFCE